MTYIDLMGEIRELGYPCEFEKFDSPPTPPFVAIRSSRDSSVNMDNQNYLDIPGYFVECYSNKRDPLTETKIQNLLRELRLPFFKSQTWIESEKLYQVVYEIQLIGEEFNEQKE